VGPALHGFIPDAFQVFRALVQQNLEQHRCLVQVFVGLGPRGFSRVLVVNLATRTASS
jgi:hypothetical protein